MKLAVIGLDDDVFDFIQRAVRSGKHELCVAIVEHGDIDRLRELEPRVETEWSWESLIATSQVDVVVVARSDDHELHDDQLRKLAQAGAKLVISHPSTSAILAYELEMISADTGSPVVPLYRGQSHPAMKVLRQAVSLGEEGPLGSLRRIEFERGLTSDTDESVMRYLALDAALASQLIGPIQRVSAVSTGDPGRNLSEMTVHLFGEDSVEARWSTAPSTETRVRLVGTDGEATLRLADDPTKWEVDSPIDALRARGTDDWDPTEPLFRSLADPSNAVWQDACRDLEISETALVSLRRKRMLDVYGDPPTEEDSFKGLMAMGSCLLLLLVLLGFGTLAVVEGIRLAMADPAEDAEPAHWPLVWRLWPVYPLLAFLALQFLLLVARRTSAKVEPPP